MAATSELEGLPLVELKKCLHDSPFFRNELKIRETRVARLEASLEKVLQSCELMVAQGQKFASSMGAVGSSIKSLSENFAQYGSLPDSCDKLSDMMGEVQKCYKTMFEQTRLNFINGLQEFVASELKTVKEARKCFEKNSENLDMCLTRNAGVPRGKPLEAEDALQALHSSTTSFTRAALDYSIRLNEVHLRKGYQIQDKVLGFLQAIFTFFTQGKDLCSDYDAVRQRMTEDSSALAQASTQRLQQLKDEYSVIKAVELDPAQNLLDRPQSPVEGSPQAIEFRGFMYKRNKNAFKTWNRRYFMLEGSQLKYIKKANDERTTVAEDVRLCTVKDAEETERRNCFALVMPDKSFYLQSDTVEACQQWKTHINAAIEAAIKETRSDKDLMERSAHPEDARKELSFSVSPGNDKCADCSLSSPTWASINLGVTLCIECSGIHRGLGVHVSKVRSIKLDEWEESVCGVMLALGNRTTNGILEFQIPPHVSKPDKTSSRKNKTDFIHRKYVEHLFVHPHKSRAPAPAPHTPTPYDHTSGESEGEGDHRRREPTPTPSISSIASVPSNFHFPSYHQRSRSQTLDPHARPPKLDVHALKKSVVSYAKKKNPFRHRHHDNQTHDNHQTHDNQSRDSDDEDSQSLSSSLSTESSEVLGKSPSRRSLKSWGLAVSLSSLRNLSSRHKGDSPRGEAPGSDSQRGPPPAPPPKPPRSGKRRSRALPEDPLHDRETSAPLLGGLPGREEEEEEQPEAMSFGGDFLEEFDRRLGDSSRSVSVGDLTHLGSGCVGPGGLPTVTITGGVTPPTYHTLGRKPHVTGVARTGSFPNSPRLGAGLRGRGSKSASSSPVCAKRSESFSAHALPMRSVDLRRKSQPITRLILSSSPSNSAPRGPLKATPDSSPQLRASGRHDYIRAARRLSAIDSDSSSSHEDTPVVEKKWIQDKETRLSDDDASIGPLGTGDRGELNGIHGDSSTDPHVMNSDSAVCEMGASPTHSELSNEERPLPAEPVTMGFDVSPDEHLFSCAGRGDIPGMMCALAHGANINCVSEGCQGRSPLIQTIYSGSVGAAEYLFLNGVRPGIRDAEGRGVLHHCAVAAATQHLILFLKKGAADFLHSIDKDGKSALELAEEMQNGDLATLLRMEKYKDESRDDADQSSLLETVRAVTHDISKKHRQSEANPPPVE